MKKKDIENLIAEEGLKSMPQINIDEIANKASIGSFESKKINKRLKPVFAVSVIIVLTLSILSGVLFGVSETEVVIEVNPSILLTITPLNTVKNVEFLNNDAKDLFNENEIKGKTLETASDYVIQKLYSAGYIDEDNDIKVTSKGKNKRKAQKICTKIKGKANAYRYGHNSNKGNN